jgi:hypothetical protein
MSKLTLLVSEALVPDDPLRAEFRMTHPELVAQSFGAHPLLTIRPVVPAKRTISIVGACRLGKHHRPPPRGSCCSLGPNTFYPRRINFFHLSGAMSPPIRSYRRRYWLESNPPMITVRQGNTVSYQLWVIRILLTRTSEARGTLIVHTTVIITAPSTCLYLWYVWLYL